MKEKIRKLLELSNSSNENEANAALAKANELMKEHNIKQSELESLEFDITEAHQDTVGQHFTWTPYLAYACAKLFDCKLVRHPDSRSFTFVGEDENLIMSKSMYEHLFQAWKTICGIDYKEDRPHNRQRYRKSHGYGFATRVLKRVEELTKERREEVTESTGKDLVPVRDSAIRQYMETKFRLKKAKSRGIMLNPDAAAKGNAAGEKVNLNRPIETRNERLLK